MSTTPAIFDSMSQEVKTDCDRRRSEAQQEAERIRAEGRRVAEREYTRGIEATRAEIEKADRRERQRLEAEAEKAHLAAQHKVVEEVLGRAREELGRLAAGEGFGPVLEGLLEEVLADVSEGQLEVLVPPSHVDLIRQFLQGRGRTDLTVVPWPELKDGVAVQDPRRSFRVSNTLSGRFRMVQDDARKFAQARLFAEEG